MGQSIVNIVVQKLNEIGLPTEPAQPAATMTAIQMPSGAVSLERVDRENRSVTVLVEVIAPVFYGALRSQHRALDVCATLTREGAVCSQGECRFDSYTATFITPVKAVFSGIALSDDWLPLQPNAVSINGQDLPYCLRVTAEKKVTEIRPTLAEVPWTVTIEEFFPAGTAEPQELDANFNVSVSSQGKREVYVSCVMKEIQRISTPEGLRQIRTATTATRVLEQ